MTTEPPHVRRPRRLWVVLSALVVLAGVLLAAAFATLRGQPLAFAPSAACCTPLRPAPAESPPPYVGGPLWNEGRFTVRITAIDGPPETETLVVPTGGPPTIESAERFAPFDLEPGAFRHVFLRATAPPCTRDAAESAQELASSGSARIHYRRFGLDRETVVATDAIGRLVFAATPAGRCAYLEEDPGG